MSACRHVRARGFTLVETVAVIVILAVIFGIGGNLLHRAFASYFAGRDIINADWRGRIALERMSRELRSVRAPDDIVVSPTQITFVDTNGATVTYVLSGTDLQRNGNTLAGSISDLRFEYVESDGRTPAGSASAVYYVSVALSVQQDNYATAYRSTLRPRNFR